MEKLNYRNGITFITYTKIYEMSINIKSIVSLMKST